MEAFNSLLIQVDNFLWGSVLVIALVGTGLFLTIRLKFIQLRGLKQGVQITRGVYDNPLDTGDLSHFQALAAALSATVGVGNIAGVAIAIQQGGPGALFWMWVTAAVGMATKFTCCTLAVKYRVVHADGSVSGGPMYYIEKGLGWKWMALTFAVVATLASFGVGCMAQAGELARALSALIGRQWLLTPELDLIRLGIGLIVAFLVGLVIIGGIKRIGQVAGWLVPFMCGFYILAAMTIILLHFDRVPSALLTIFHDAFTGTAALGGFAGSTFIYAMRMGVARGLFSNESGMGSAPIAHAAAKTPYPIREGYVALLEPFIDTIIVCSMTGLVLILTGVWSGNPAIGGAELSSLAFNRGLTAFPGLGEGAQLGRWLVAIGVVFFAYSTAISWSYYGDRCASYLLGLRAVTPYRWVFCVFLVIGATIKIDLVWNLCDIMNGCMALPNLVALLFLSGVVARDLAEYNQKIPEFERARN